MDNITTIGALIAELAALVSAIAPMVVVIRKISNGTRCQLRSEMLRIYYHNREAKTIRQYEYENFLLLYEAYEALKGNSFMVKIRNEVNEWEVIP